MTRITISQLIAGAFIALCLATGPAGALSSHTYVSGKGVDTGACIHPATACRTFAFAIAQTAAGGQIIAIDPANYERVTINKSISIVADGGGPAGIFINAGTAITIIAGPDPGPGIIVNLRGLTLDGSGTASTGISAGTGISSSAVTITDCFIRNFRGTGINLLGDLTFRISNTVSSDNSAVGLFSGGFFGAKGVVDHFTASGDNIGIDVEGSRSGPNDVTIVDSVMADNVSDGLVVGNNIQRATVRLAGSVVKGNGTGVKIAFILSTAFSYGDNEINGNGTDVIGILTPLAKR